MKVYPDYTPKPQPNMSTKPVEAPVMPAGKQVTADEVREQINSALNIASPTRKIR
jgi:hypothetical protein